MTLVLDIVVGSETWERPTFPLDLRLDSSHYSVLSYCRGRETPAIRTHGKHQGKAYPGKTGGGAVILYNKNRFTATDTDIGVPPGIEAVLCVLAPLHLDDKLQKVRRICVGSIYIAPRSPFKEETITHIIHTIQLVRARYNNEVHFLLAGDYNRFCIQDMM